MPRTPNVRLLSIGLLSLLPVSAAAPPTPAGSFPSGVVQEGDTLTRQYDIAGLTVIHRLAPGSGVVAVNLYLLGGARQVTDSTAGIESLLLHASEHGTNRYPGLATRNALAQTGGWVVIDAEADWTMFGMRTQVETFDSTWAVFTDRVVSPTLDTMAVEVERAKLIAQARARESTPDEKVRSIALRAAFEEHPYRVDVRGSEGSLSRIEISQLQAYQAQHLVKSRMLLVVVGDIPYEKLQASVEATLGQLPAGDYKWELPPVWVGDRPSVTAVRRGLLTRYILGYFGGPLASSEDHAAFHVAVVMLSSLISWVAHEEGYSYAGRAIFFDQGAAGGGIYFSTNVPADCIELANDGIDLLKNMSLRRSVIRDYARSSLLDYYLRSETSEEQADLIGRAFLYRGELSTPEAHLEGFRTVSGNDVRNAARRYFKNIQYALLGDTTVIPRKKMTKY